MAFSVFTNGTGSSTSKFKVSMINPDLAAPKGYGTPVINYVHLKGKDIHKGKPSKIEHWGTPRFIIVEYGTPGTDELIVWFYAYGTKRPPTVGISDLVVTVETVAGVVETGTDPKVTST